MANPTLVGITRKLGSSNVVEDLVDRLSLSELNSLLMEVFHQKSKSLKPAHLTESYRTNRFVAPSSISALTFARETATWLEQAEARGFSTLELSPLAPLGSCSAIGKTSQNKIVSALRGTEIVADATNLLALEAARIRTTAFQDDYKAKLCSVHRHVRAQALPPGMGFTAHFKVFCAVTAGKDIGNLLFEKETTTEHLKMYLEHLKNSGISGKVILKLIGETEEERERYNKVVSYVIDQLSGFEVSKIYVPAIEHQYYTGLRFSLNMVYDGKEINIGDGGFVDWARKLTGNNKELLFISAIGMELLLKIRAGQL